MNRIKDKLAESVRQARSAPAAAAPRPQTAKSAAKALTGPVPKPARRAAAAMPSTPAVDDAPRSRTGGEPPISAGALFPGRVWPD
ncbi:hypothetical protein [Thiomonas sp.]|jgi:hypothetical protein|uniref:hypothetical protein n=1 Tax=Thiomonas sp. TaxID=2047785 RepID=UPI002624B26F|nr:hypothetical protein [Thiomonas sp.]